MSELYWITRCNGICTVAIIFLVLSAAGLGLTLVGYFVGESEKDKKITKNFFKISFPTFIVSILLVLFVPTTKEALLIYGVDGTMDYIKSNPTAKQIPDKCIKALDKWVDSWSINKKDSIK